MDDLRRLVLLPLLALPLAACGADDPADLPALAPPPARPAGTADPTPDWPQQGEVHAGDGHAEDGFGIAVALDGDTALVGALNHGVGEHAEQGAAYVFARSGGRWAQIAELSAGDGAREDHFGAAVALRGETALVGAPDHDLSRGAVYVFVKSGATWTQAAKLGAGDAENMALFGAAVAFDGDTALIGAPGHAIGSEYERGAAYVFAGSGASWTQQDKLLAADGAGRENLGAAVALDGDTALVGAPRHPVGENKDQGAAYVFSRSGGSWTEVALLAAGSGGPSDFFGASVALSGGTALVGARGHAQGAAYLFTGVTGWAAGAEITAPDGAYSDQFGAAVALSGGIAVIGAPGLNLNQGAAYVFAHSGGEWAQAAEITASDGDIGDGLGSSVAVTGGTALVGASQHRVGNSANQGAVYIHVGPACAEGADCPVSGCSCQAAGSERSGAAWWLGILGLAFSRSRRRWS